MAYFKEQYPNVFFIIADENSEGLRNAQLGAIHAISSYYTLYDKKPALVVMPTGSGKTSVLIMTAYLQRVNRVLIITPSKLVRGQIFEEFSQLITLKRLGVLPKIIKNPKVIEIKGYLKTKTEWEKLTEYDVVVSTPNCFYEAIKNHIEIPENLFDLILVDEAHHSSAISWDAIISYFKDSKKVFFTATPFRKDKKEIEGELIYSYPLSKAFDDKIFSEIMFFPVDEKNGIENDITLASEAEKKFKEDRESGFDHYLFVRTNSLEHGKKLFAVYNAHTGLKLKIVDSTQTFKTIKKVIEELKNKQLDGVICVNMLGEGFDFPNLKIAAIHKPHKSLAATLQFIGRFVRTNASNIGEAKFLAIVNEELEIENTQLYSNDALWRDKIIDMSEGRIEREGEVKRALNTFRDIYPEQENYDDLSIYNINPFFHVKIYKVNDFQYPKSIEITNNEVIKYLISDEYKSIIIITKEITRPKWLAIDQLINVEHNLFIIYFDSSSRLLFINSSLKTIGFYDNIIKQLTSSKFERISKSQINKVLVEVENPEFFNIGLANRMGTSGETYKILAGPSAQNVLSKSDGRLYSGGHVFVKGVSAGNNITIGYSSASKVWSNRYDQIPLFIKWCKDVGSKILSSKEVNTNSNFDNIPKGILINEFPHEVYFGTWNAETYMNPPIISVGDTSSNVVQILDFDICIIKENNFNNKRVLIDLKHNDITIPLSYDFEDHYKIRDGQDDDYNVSFESEDINLIYYLNEFPLDLYLTENFEEISNHEFLASPKVEINPFDVGQIFVFDWELYKTDTKQEFGTRNSIHETLKAYLLISNYDIIIYDHGSGEIADFLTVKNDSEIKIELYHVKAAKGDSATGNRVDEVYEVVGQAIKSLKWLINFSTFIKHLKRRTHNKSEKYIKGDSAILESIFSESKRKSFEINIVQPGISKSGFTQKIGELFAACDHYIRVSGHNILKVYGSN